MGESGCRIYAQSECAGRLGVGGDVSRLGTSLSKMHSSPPKNHREQALEERTPLVARQSASFSEEGRMGR